MENPLQTTTMLTSRPLFLFLYFFLFLSPPDPLLSRENVMAEWQACVYKSVFLLAIYAAQPALRVQRC